MAPCRPILTCDVCCPSLQVSALNDLHGADKIDSLALWKHAHRALSAPANVLALEFGAPAQFASRRESTCITIEHGGTCHALAMWLDYYADAEGDDAGSGGDAAGVPWSSSAPALTGEATPYLQGVHFCRAPRVLGRGEVVTCAANLDVRSGVLMASLTL